MKVIKSPFILRNFLLLKQNIEFLPPPNNHEINIPEITDSYNIDMDFTIQDTLKPFFQIFVKVEINQNDPQQLGYAIFSEGVGIFEFDNSVELDELEKGNYLYFSGLSICINSLRSIIANVTSHGPFGKYTFPSIDLNVLINDKKSLTAKSETK